MQGGEVLDDDQGSGGRLGGYAAAVVEQWGGFEPVCVKAGTELEVM